jgi:hypothetical protein
MMPNDLYIAWEIQANKSLKEHKGKKILRFKEINSNLIRSLDNP